MIKEEIKNKIVYPLLNPQLAREYGRTIGGGIMMYGPPGCGKTYLAQATAGECKASFFNVKITDLLSPVEGETEKRLHSIFERASRNTPAVIFFDEIDAIAGQRTSAAAGAERRLINQFLTEMDGFEKKEGVVVLAATNAPWDIDPALRRAGRFSDQIFLPPPDAHGREDVFRIHSKKLPTQDLDMAVLGSLTDGYSSADIKLICEEAAKIPWAETMRTGVKRPINMDDFRKTIAARQSSLAPWFKQAAIQLAARGEADVYPELARLVKKQMSAGVQEAQSLQFAQMDAEQEALKAMLEVAKDKYKNGEIDEATLRYLANDYERRIIEIVAKVGMEKAKLARSK